VGVGDQAADRPGTIGAVKADESHGSAGVAVGGLGDLKHRAGAIRPAAYRCAKEVAVGVGD
jgi:hypothetical protein